ncbi:hypothetical protein [Ruminococcus sp.]
MSFLRRSAYAEEKKHNPIIVVLLVLLGSFFLGFLGWNIFWYYSLSSNIEPKVKAFGITDYSPLKNMLNCYKAQFSEEYEQSDEYQSSYFYTVYDDKNDVYYNIRTPFYLFDRSYLLSVEHRYYDEITDKETIGEKVEYNYPEKERVYIFHRIIESDDHSGYNDIGASYLINTDDSLKRIIPFDVNSNNDTLKKYEEVFSDYHDSFLKLEELVKDVLGKDVFKK